MFMFFFFFTLLCGAREKQYFCLPTVETSFFGKILYVRPHKPSSIRSPSHPWESSPQVSSLLTPGGFAHLTCLALVSGEPARRKSFVGYEVFRSFLVRCRGLSDWRWAYRVLLHVVYMRFALSLSRFPVALRALVKDRDTTEALAVRLSLPELLL